MFRYAGIILLVAGDWIFQKLQMPYPMWYLQMREKKLLVGATIFFGINMISNWATSTGAFEVTYGSELIYSAISTKRLPSLEDILYLIGKLNN